MCANVILGTQQICKLMFNLLWHMILDPVPFSQISSRPGPGWANHNPLSYMGWVWYDAGTKEHHLGAPLRHLTSKMAAADVSPFLWFALGLTNCSNYFDSWFWQLLHLVPKVDACTLSLIPRDTGHSLKVCYYPGPRKSPRNQLWSISQRKSLDDIID